MEKTYTLDWCEVKLEGKLKDCKAITGEEFSIWRIDTKGVPFPDFDKIAPGSTIIGNPWTNPKNGKITLYPPKAKISTFPRGGNTAAITKAMDRKEGSIKEFQESKQDSMRVFAAYRDATSIVTAFLPKDKYDPIFIQQELNVWRKKFMDDISGSLNTPF